MKVEATKTEVFYNVTLSQDEAELIAAIVGNQSGGENLVSSIYRELTNAGIDPYKWTAKRNFDVDVWSRK